MYLDTHLGKISQKKTKTKKSNMWKERKKEGRWQWYDVFVSRWRHRQYEIVN